MPRTIYSSAFTAILKKPVFGVRDLSCLGVPSDYARQRLHQLVAASRIRRIERGKYTFYDDPMLVATHITEPCYLSLWSAISERGLTTQIPFSIQIVTSRKRFTRKLTFMGSEIRFYTVRPGMMFGYELITSSDGRRIPVAKVEKAIVDAIYLNEIPLGEMVDAMEFADQALLKEYSELTGNRRVMEKVKEMLRC